MTYRLCSHDSCSKFDTTAAVVSEVATLDATTSAVEPEWTRTEQVPAGASYMNKQGKCVSSCEWFEKNKIL